jgi:enoyl-CoA hydratase/carnithine racemase
MTAPVTVTDEGAVRIVRMNRPEKKNALTLAMYREMARALREADQSNTIRCNVIAGVPGAFCAGNDITDFLNASSGGLDPRVSEFFASAGAPAEAAGRRGRRRGGRRRHDHAVSLRSCGGE